MFLKTKLLVKSGRGGVVRGAASHHNAFARTSLADTQYGKKRLVQNSV